MIFHQNSPIFFSTFEKFLRGRGNYSLLSSDSYGTAIMASKWSKINFWAQIWKKSIFELKNRHKNELEINFWSQNHFYTFFKSFRTRHSFQLHSTICFQHLNFHGLFWLIIRRYLNSHTIFNHFGKFPELITKRAVRCCWQRKSFEMLLFF